MPIFGELEAGERGNVQPVGRRWHLAAKRQHDLDVKGEHLIPLHVGHHDDHTHVRRAGFLHVVDVGSLTYRGRQMSALFGDLYVTKEIAAEIKACGLPYISVEVSPDWDKPEILGAALLDHEPPHFKFPLITLDEGSNFTKRGNMVTFKLETAMADTKDPKKKKPADDESESTDDDAEPDSDESEKMADDVANPEADAMPPTEEIPPAPAAPAANPGSDVAPAITAAMAPFMAMLTNGFARLEAAISGGAVKPTDIPGNSANATGNPPLVEPFKDKKKATTMSDATNFQAKLVSLEAEVAKFKQEKKRNDEIAAAEGELKKIGFTITPEIRKTLEEAAANNFTAQAVQIFKKHAIADPPQSVEDGLDGAEAVEEDLDPELEPFAAQGADVLTAAKRAHAQWCRSVERGSQLTWTQFCRAEGISLAAKK